jgi:NhaP-type Na+/H+ or K+/H+ antiporter
MNSRNEQLLVGWAGPIGLASIYYSTLITRRLHWDPAWVITSLMVFSSVVVHGLMTPHIVKWLGTKKERE